MKIWQEFTYFIQRGNVVDMAVGIIMGASFQKIINILVNNILMPPIGVLIGGMDFSDFSLTIKKATQTQQAVTIDIGLFINSLIDFFIIALSVFLLIKMVNVIYHKKPVKKDSKRCPECALEIPKNARRCGYCTSVF